VEAASDEGAATPPAAAAAGTGRSAEIEPQAPPSRQEPARPDELTGPTVQAVPPDRPSAEAAGSSIFAEAELPDRFAIPRLAEAEGEDQSLTAKLRAAREAPESLLPHLREVEQNPGSEFSRVMRDLRRVLEQRFETEPIVIAIVSERRDCGKSTLAANLARAFADSGSRVVILDADRRHATLTQAMGTEAPEGRLRIAEGMRPVFALDGSWRSGVFLSSLALGRSGIPGAARRSGAPMPSFSSVKALADVLIIDTQSGTLGPSLGPDLPVDATLILAPVEDGDNGSRQHLFARLELATGSGRLRMEEARRRADDEGERSPYSGLASLRRRRRAFG
jgi:Mrp family chromosome partitioning ATPase